MRVITSSLLVLGLALSMSLGCADPGEKKSETETQALTYHKDVRPLLEQHCTSCHVKGGLAPFPLTSFKLLDTYKDKVVTSVKNRTMPPWHADKACGVDYKHDISLSDAEIQTFTKWLEEGAKEGDEKDYKTPTAKENSTQLPRVDLKLKIETPYNQKKFPDDYHCFVMDWPHKTTKYVTGFHVVPGNEAIVHHVIIYLVTPDQVAAYSKLDAAEDGPGYTCYGGSGGPSRGWLGAWAPGGPAAPYPEGTGIKIEPGSKIVMQVHYNSFTPKPDADQTVVELMLSDKVEKEARIIPFTNPAWLDSKKMKIAANDKEAFHEFSVKLAAYVKAEVDIHSASLHLHTLGKSGNIFIEREDGSEECLLNIKNWDFNWQRSYGFKKVRTLGMNDKLGIRCTWDNSQANQPYANGKQIESKDVYWGEGTTDEMCLGVLYVTMKSK